MRIPNYRIRKKGNQLLVEFSNHESYGCGPLRDTYFTEQFSLNGLTSEAVVTELAKRSTRDGFNFSEKAGDTKETVQEYMMQQLTEALSVVNSGSKYAEHTFRRYELERMEKLEKILRRYQKDGSLPQKVPKILDVDFRNFVEGPALREVFSAEVIGICNGVLTKPTWYDRVSRYMSEDPASSYLINEDTRCTYGHKFNVNSLELVTVFGPESEKYNEYWNRVLRVMSKILAPKGTFLLVFHEFHEYDGKITPNKEQMEEKVRVLESAGIRGIIPIEENLDFTQSGEEDEFEYPTKEALFDKFFFIGRKS